ncbi:MKRN2 opposite strand, tandem duplicate 1 [Sinocyclocheilus anshuiensis]|uniref:MKRN2 opposite strand, tandem duplicate 1 n=1 Tax=Sinocyclocheilus anshuiensis TaxID=1608454 RepID=UPI0007B975C0|nr:PREDICTED: MKRN2 opposite strand protein-like [Sinocyclocheilus anshuiensis]
MERTVIKYRHCGRNIHRFSAPDASCSPRADDSQRSCPICHHTLAFGLLDAPVALTCPIRNGHTVPCAFLIGSMHGPSHLGEWHDTEIHVGLSNSEGLVYNYTLSGVRRDVRGWEQCVCIQLCPPWRDELRESWDRELEQFSALPEWVSERFDEEREFGSCCYGFALTFINHMRSLDGKASLSRDQFTGSHILPRMKTVSLYINIYHAILQHGFYIANTDHDM